jgi:hypothetical protein
MKKNKFEPGDVYAVALKGGGFAFGVVCEGNDFAFFDHRADTPVAPENLLNCALVFRVPVAKDAPKMGKWMHVGKIPLYGEYAKPGKYLHKPIGSEQCFIYSAGNEVPARFEEAKDLEVLSTWFSFHIEERLEDFFAGRPNAYVDAIRNHLGI